MWSVVVAAGNIRDDVDNTCTVFVDATPVNATSQCPGFRVQ